MIFVLMMAFVLSLAITEVFALTTSDSTVRTADSIYLIDDDGQFNNPMDIVYFETYSGKSISEWKALGYDDVKITITINMHEVQDGYQYVYVYRNDYSTNTGNYLFYQENIEHGPGYKETTWSDYSFTTITIDLDDFVDDKFAIRYNASGWFGDDWENRNLRVHFYFD